MKVVNISINILELNKDLLPVNSKLGSLKHSSTNQLDSPSKIVDKSKIVRLWLALARIILLI